MKHQLCRNCGSEVTGNYCSSCGQRTNTYRLGWGSLAESLTSTFIGDEAYGLRGINMRKGTVTTWLSILCQPHRAISEYISGSRRKYFNPVAILLLLSTVYAVVYALVGKTYTPSAEPGQHPVLWLMNTYIDYASLHPAASMLLMLPFNALALKTVFCRRSGLRLVEYLYIGIFLSIFEVTLMTLDLPARVFLPGISTFLALTLPTFLYTAFVLRKLFSLRIRGALLRTLLVQTLQYAYVITAVTLLLTFAMGGYYLVAPEDFKRSVVALTESQAEPDSPDKPSVLKEIIGGIVDGLCGDRTTEADGQTPEAAADNTAGEATPDADEPSDTAADKPADENSLRNIIRKAARKTDAKAEE